MKFLSEDMNNGETDMPATDTQKRNSSSSQGEVTTPTSSTPPMERDRKHVRIREMVNGGASPRDRSPVDRIPRSPRLDGSGRRRKLVLHVDLRNTILVADSVTNVAVEQALNAFLTGATWGYEKDGLWEWHSDVPSVKVCLKSFDSILFDCLDSPVPM